jgi:hypothetical protein
MASRAGLAGAPIDLAVPCYELSEKEHAGLFGLGKAELSSKHWKE